MVAEEPEEAVEEVGVQSLLEGMITPRRAPRAEFDSAFRLTLTPSPVREAPEESGHLHRRLESSEQRVDMVLGQQSGVQAEVSYI